MKKTIKIVVMATLCPFLPNRERPCEKSKQQRPITIRLLAALAFRETRPKKLFHSLTILVLVLMFSLISGVNGQESYSNIQPLRIGEKVPENFWKIKHTFFGQGKITIHDLSIYRGKLLVLNFWATWCGSCVAHMPDNEKISTELNGIFYLVPITREPYTKISNFFSNNDHVKNIKLPTIVSDVALKDFFPHQILPHYIWISKEGEVLASSEHEMFTRDNIRKLANGREVSLDEKIDQDMDKPLYLSKEIQGNVEVRQSTILIKGRIKGLPTIKKIRTKENKTTGVLYANQPLLRIYADLGKGLISGFNRKRIIIAHDNLTPLQSDNGEFGDEEYYSFDVNQTPFTDSILLEQLNLSSGFLGRIENRKVACMILSKVGPIQKLASLGGERVNGLFEKDSSCIRNGTIKAMVARMNDIDIPLPVVIDETGISERIDISLKSDPSDLNGLNRELKDYGLALIPQERNMDMLVISKGKTVQQKSTEIQKAGL
ncbi:hypothetical protein [Pedobacter jamesrossensis]|uniref:Thioredoxin domain-containing protein n=1 Tax=Pedobacter jamesrossensis TaxID=1908238 RepID=A0ABV8NLU6_9SPHI